MRSSVVVEPDPIPNHAGSVLDAVEAVAMNALLVEFGLNNPQIIDFMQNYGDFSRELLRKRCFGPTCSAPF